MSDPAKILLLPICGLGDAVCYLPCIHALRTKYPNAHITLFVASDVAKAVIENASCDIEVIVFNRSGRRRWTSLVSLLRRIRRGRYDVVVSGAHQNSVRVPLFAAVSGARIRIGARMERLSFLYNRQVDVRTDGHVFERFRRLLSAIEVEIPAHDYRPRVRLVPEARDAALALWKAAGLSEDQVVVGIASGADHISRGPWKPYLKRWSTERYGKLVKWLSGLGVKVVMFGGKEEEAIADQIAAYSGSSLVNLCGRTSVPELSWLLSKCATLIANDTGVMHLGAAVGTPVIALFGPTNAMTVCPTSELGRSLQGQADCSPCYPFPTCDLSGCKAMDDISFETVRDRVSATLELSAVPVGARSLGRWLIQIENTAMSSQSNGSY